MNDELTRLARSLRVFFCDSDGVLFSGSVLMGMPHKAKQRSHIDGQGISLLRAAGIRIVFITNEKDDHAAAIRETVEKFNSLPSSKPQKNDGWEPVVLFEGRGGEKKLEAAENFLREHHLTMESAAYMGDDINDAPLLLKVALPAAPVSAEEAIKKIAKFVSERPGGAGAIRDFVNTILEARGIDPLTLPTQ
ncbi:MAG: 3-deoxy-D-manno-octulosonate 8-phosphate phosphatase [Parcubacteria group bacterium GW2011_GWA2_51_10]|nr:MAG: 3-deoxy-D-manno-octulosonate 8-phosphate phosphatase [Parcubacteria group bacterium GW2011_GWA2_51_10]